MPYAPDVVLLAWTFQPLSLFQSASRQENWDEDQPNELSIPCAICCGDPAAAVTGDPLEGGLAVV